MRAIHRVVLADDHALIRQGFKLILSTRYDFCVMGESRDGRELLELLKKGPAPDAVIVDLSMPRLNGICAIREIRKSYAAIKLLAATMHEEEEFICEAFLAGADGYLLKKDAAGGLLTALDAILIGRPYLSPSLARQLQGRWLMPFLEGDDVSVDEPPLKKSAVLRLLAGEILGRRLPIRPAIPDVA